VGATADGMPLLSRQQELSDSLLCFTKPVCNATVPSACLENSVGSLQSDVYTGGRPAAQTDRDGGQHGYYHWQEFTIGTHVHVYGRDMLVIDMDDFTRRWYEDQLGCKPQDLRPIEV
jgi:hypothetical protein